MVVLQHKLIYHYLVNNLGVFAFPIKLTIRLVDESLPNIVGAPGITALRYATQDVSGAFSLSQVSTAAYTMSASRTEHLMTFNAHDSSPVYKDGAHVRPPSLITNFYIRY